MLERRQRWPDRCPGPREVCGVLGERNQTGCNVSDRRRCPGHGCPRAALRSERYLTEPRAPCCQEPEQGCHIRPGAAPLPRTRRVPKPPPTRCIQPLTASPTDATAHNPSPGARSRQQLTSRPPCQRGQRTPEPTGGMCQASLRGGPLRSPRAGSTHGSQDLPGEGVVHEGPAAGQTVGAMG